jgi:peptidoglycan/xylan/chitin deacetylase (PgdA/CDA1 family)
MKFTKIGLRKAACFAACVSTAAAATACGAASARAQHLSSGCANNRNIALTFDDGPNPPYTGQILDLLAAKGAKATFFAEGEAVEAHPDSARDEAARGMAVGSHSFGHSADLPQMSHAAFAADLVRAEKALSDVMGDKLYRSPFGHTSDTMLEEEHKRGYTSIGWDIDSEDWSDASVDRVISNVLDHAHPGAIVLMHDGGLSGGNPDRSTTLAALPRVVDGLRGQGYSLVTVPEIIGTQRQAGGTGAACSAS